MKRTLFTLVLLVVSPRFWKFSLSLLFDLSHLSLHVVFLVFFFLLKFVSWECVTSTQPPPPPTSRPFFSLSGDDTLSAWFHLRSLNLFFVVVTVVVLVVLVPLAVVSFTFFSWTKESRCFALDRGLNLVDCTTNCSTVDFCTALHPPQLLDP